MSSREAVAAPVRGVVVHRERLDEHLVRLEVEVPGFRTTGVPDEWVALTVPGQFQARYYTVRAVAGEVLTLDVVVHDVGLVTGWVVTDCVGDVVGVGPPKGSFRLPADAGWLALVGDLTALPAMARIVEDVAATAAGIGVRVWAEVAGRIPGYFPGAGAAEVAWLQPPATGSGLADLVASLDLPDTPGYFWMAGESAQMRAIRRHLRRDRGWGGHNHDVMGYWSASRGRGGRAVDPVPSYARARGGER